MCPSEYIQLLISKQINFDLSQYSWSDSEKSEFFNIPLDSLFEYQLCEQFPNITLADVYKLGLNIGHCGLTSRYLFKEIYKTNSEARLTYGKLPIIAGTKSSAIVGHAWVLSSSKIFDPTLMISIPTEIANKIGYLTEKEIDPTCSLELSEYDTFSNEYFNHFKKERSNYIKSLFQGLNIEYLEKNKIDFDLDL